METKEYIPLDELAVNKKKVKEVRDWLDKAFLSIDVVSDVPRID
jgi:hypothetical protein